MKAHAVGGIRRFSRSWRTWRQVAVGCLDNLCKLQLYIYRDVEPRVSPADMALN